MNIFLHRRLLFYNVKRFHLIEFQDYNWFPRKVREGITDYLRFFISLFQLYSPVAKALKDTLEITGEQEITDLCSGGGGEIINIAKELDKITGKKYKITLTDKFPNLPSFEYIRKSSDNRFAFTENPIDALTVSKNMKGLKTIFSAFHHFDFETGKKVLQNAVDNKSSIAIFDSAERKWLYILAVLFSTVFFMFFCTPFFKPFKLSRIIFTYVIPMIPVFGLWDGIISMLRIYTPDELMQLAMETNSNHYIWKSGLLKNKIGTNVTYLIGYPL